MNIMMLWMKNVVKKRNFKCLLLMAGLVMGIIYLIIQFFSMLVLSGGDSQNSVDLLSFFHRGSITIKRISSKWNDSQHLKLVDDKNGYHVSLRGIRNQDIKRYFPNSRGKFTCFVSKEEIDFFKVNDDYCDCPLDGSDEPGTNACNKGTFYCEVPSEKFRDKIPSYMVNDGVCDCCDGCDEWIGVPLLSQSKNEGEFVRMCPNRC